MKKKLTAGTIVLCLALAGAAWAESNMTEVNKIDLTKDDQASLAQVLMKNTGKAVSVKLRSGEELAGKVVVVSKGMLHLAELKGREFSDAVVGMDAVSAVIIPVRAMKKN